MIPVFFEYFLFYLATLTYLSLFNLRTTRSLREEEFLI